MIIVFYVIFWIFNKDLAYNRAWFECFLDRVCCKVSVETVLKDLKAVVAFGEQLS